MRVGLRVLKEDGTPFTGHAAIYGHLNDTRYVEGGPHPEIPGTRAGWVGCVGPAHPMGAGYAEINHADPGWLLLHPMGHAPAQPFPVPDREGQTFVVVRSGARGNGTVLEWDGGAPPDLVAPPAGGLKPRPFAPPLMGFERTNPPTNLTGDSLILLGKGKLGFVGFSGPLNILHGRSDLSYEQLRTIVALVHSVGGNMIRTLRGLNRPGGSYISPRSQGGGVRLMYLMDECRERGVYHLYCFTDQPDRNSKEGLPGEILYHGRDELSTSLMRAMTDEELASWRSDGGFSDDGEALIVEIANEGETSWLTDEVNGQIYDQLGKERFRNRWISNISADHRRYFDGSPLTVHMHPSMPRDPEGIIRTLREIQAKAEGKPLILDFDGTRMWKFVPNVQDAFKGLDAMLEIVQACAENGHGVIANVTEPFEPWDPFKVVRLPAPYPGSNDREITTFEAYRRFTAAAGVKP